MLLTTQYLNEADQLVGKLVIVDHGRTIAAGTPAELKRQVGGNVIDVRAQRRDQLAAIAAALAPRRRRRAVLARTYVRARDTWTPGGPHG